MEQLQARHKQEQSKLQQQAGQQEKSAKAKASALKTLTSNLDELVKQHKLDKETLTAAAEAARQGVIAAAEKRVEEAKKEEKGAKEQLEKTKKDIETLKASQEKGLDELTETQQVYKQRLQGELEATVDTLRTNNLRSETKIVGMRNACMEELDEAKKELAKKEDEAKIELAKKGDEAKIELAKKEKAETDARIEASMHSFIHAIKYLNELKARIEMGAGKTGKEETDVAGEGATTVEAPITPPDNAAEGGGHELNRGKRTLKKSRYTGGKRIRRGGSRMNRRTLQRRKFRMRGGGNTTFEAISTTLEGKDYHVLMSATNEDEDDNNKIKVFRKYYVGLARQFADIYYSSLFTQKDKEVSDAKKDLDRAKTDLEASTKTLAEMENKYKAAGSEPSEVQKAELEQIRSELEQTQSELELTQSVWEEAKRQLIEQQEKAATATEEATRTATEAKDAAVKGVTDEAAVAASLAADTQAKIQSEIQALQNQLEAAKTAQAEQLATAGVAGTKATAEATAMKAEADADVVTAQGEVAAAKAEVAKITAELDKAQKGKQDADSALTDATEENAALQTAVGEATTKASAVQEKADADVAAAQAAVAAAQAGVASITAELVKAQKGKQDAETELEEAKKAAASATGKDKKIAKLQAALESYKYLDGQIKVKTIGYGGGIYRGGGEISESRRIFLQVLLNKLDSFQSFESSSDSSSERKKMIAATVYILFGGFTLDTGYTEETVDKLVALFISSISEGIKNKLPQKFTCTEADVKKFFDGHGLSLADDEYLDPNRVNFDGPKRNIYLEELRNMNTEIGEEVNAKVLKFAKLCKEDGDLNDASVAVCRVDTIDKEMNVFYELFNQHYGGGILQNIVWKHLMRPPYKKWMKTVLK